MKNRINVKFSTEISILRTPEFKNGLSICMFSLCKRKASANTTGPVLSKFTRNLCNYVYNRLGTIIYFENKLRFKTIYSIISKYLMFTLKKKRLWAPFGSLISKSGVEVHKTTSQWMKNISRNRRVKIRSSMVYLLMFLWLN